MRCPFCGHDETQVKDSRPSEDNSSIRRRRQCPACAARFTTFERVQLRELMVIKKDESRTLFDREKLVRSINISCRKRPVKQEQIELITNSIQRRLESSGETDIPTKVIGELVMDALKELDRVAYLRFASVYKDFKETDDFRKFIDKNLNLKED
ncbi:MAG: transcriptional regulator NrdR [Alphaproteobacteria bacterium]|mgnify:FL=1|tara:strand:+ start:249 stop:710 length:462 start_codon:yes stop_codon:yes gene_type:complete